MDEGQRWGRQRVFWDGDELGSRVATIMSRIRRTAHRAKWEEEKKMKEEHKRIEPQEK
jgi:hypothetical protein